MMIEAGRSASTPVSYECKQCSGCNLVEHVDCPRFRASRTRGEARWLEPEDPSRSTVEVQGGGADGVGAEKSVQEAKGIFRSRVDLRDRGKAERALTILSRPIEIWRGRRLEPRSEHVVALRRLDPGLVAIVEVGHSLSSERAGASLKIVSFQAVENLGIGKRRDGFAESFRDWVLARRLDAGGMRGGRRRGRLLQWGCVMSRESIVTVVGAAACDVVDLLRSTTPPTSSTAAGSTF